MGTYQFEMVASISDVIDIEADSYEEALAEAREEAESWYAVAPAGYSMPWDDIALDCISEPEDDYNA